MSVIMTFVYLLTGYIGIGNNVIKNPPKQTKTKNPTTMAY